jgi:hypothetical protein
VDPEEEDTETATRKHVKSRRKRKKGPDNGSKSA